MARTPGGIVGSVDNKRPHLVFTSDRRLENNKTVNHQSQYGTEIELMGAAGELAALRYFGYREVLGTHFDGGRDMVWRGWDIDVKSTKMQNLPYGFLQWPTHKTIKSDIIVLVGIEITTLEFEIVGFAFKQEFDRLDINEKADQPCWEIAMKNLHPTCELKSLPYLRRRDPKTARLSARA